MSICANFYHYKIRFRGLQGVFLFPEFFVIFIKKRENTHTFLSNAHTIPMKKNDHLPDFHKLCSPGQNHITLFISQQIFFFFLGAIGGFLWEVLLMLAKAGQFANRGFLYGPWLPIYGIGAVLFYLLLGDRKILYTPSTAAHSLSLPSSKASCRKSAKKHPFRIFFLSMLIGTGLELLIGWFLDFGWNLRYWDYRSYPLNYNGYICIWSAAGFGIAGVLWICLLSSRITRLWLRFSGKSRTNINTILILIFLLDCTASLIFPNTGPNVTFP